MSAQLGNFDPNAHVPSTAFDPLPIGWYAMQIIDSEMKQTQSGGQMLVLTFEIIEALHPEHKGRRVWDRLNVVNASEKAQSIAASQLSSICKAIGQVSTLTDSEQLHHRPMAVKLKIEAASGNYDAQNKPGGYDAVTSRFAMANAPTPPASIPPAAPPGVPQATPAPAAAASATPPWDTAAPGPSAPF